MSPRALAAVLWIAAGAFGSEVAAQALPQDEPRRAIRLLAGVPGDLDMALEGDFAQRDGLSLLGSVHRWSFDDVGCVSSVIYDGVASSRPTQRSPTCPPHGWAVGIALRATPHPRRAVSAFVQGELGLYRYDGSSLVTPLVAGRSGVVATAARGLSVEAGLKVQYMTSAEWKGRYAGSQLVGTWQIGFGIPIS
jgi:hypothetical protein